MYKIKKVTPKYQVENTFKITDRGLFSVGEVVEGIIQRGDWIVFEFNGKKLERKRIGIQHKLLPKYFQTYEIRIKIY